MLCFPIFYITNKIGSKLIFLPIALFVVDVIEDVLSIVMLKTAQFIPVASAVSATKNILTYACSIVILVFLIMWLVKRKKK